jgi:hypothetical protein
MRFFLLGLFSVFFFLVYGVIVVFFICNRVINFIFSIKGYDGKVVHYKDFRR